jgi:TRAP-type C4-dicarboxylate transport system permease small subunit
MKAAYVRAMDALYIACIAVAGLCMVVMTLIIPAGVYARYVLNSALAWPEPAATVMMIYFSFLGGAAVYRANVHIAVVALLDAVRPATRRVMLWAVDACMVVISLFMIVYGDNLVRLTWTQVVADFPWMPVGFTYLPIPICGAVTMLFIAERIWVGLPGEHSIMYSDKPVELD